MLRTFDPRGNTDDLSVTYLDEDVTNVNLSNLSWNIDCYVPKNVPGITCPKDTVVPIYGYSRYGMTSSGNIVNLDTGDSIPGSVDTASRRTVYLVGDDKVRRRCWVHRLVALTFLMHPIDTDHLVVNHLDGNSLNNHMANLEWTTHAGNNRHAFETGLRLSVEVLCKDILTGDVTSHLTLTACARAIGVDPNYLHTYVAARRVAKFSLVKKRYMVKSATDLTPWPIEPTPTSRVFIYSGPVEVLDLRSKKVTQWKNLAAACFHFDVPKSTGTNLILSKTPIPYGSIIMRKKSDDPWPTYPDYIVAVFNQMRNASKPVKVTDTETGNVTYWAGTKYWARQNSEVDPATISRSVVKTGTFRKWKFEYINLFDYAFEPR